MSRKKSFEEIMSSIQMITEQLEGQQEDLETSLQLFKEGKKLILEAKTRLQDLTHDFHVIDSAPGNKVK